MHLEVWLAAGSARPSSPQGVRGAPAPPGHASMVQHVPPRPCTDVRQPARPRTRLPDRAGSNDARVGSVVDRDPAAGCGHEPGSQTQGRQREGNAVNFHIHVVQAAAEDRAILRATR